VRLASSSGTTRGLDGEAFALVGNLVADVWDSVGEDGLPDPAVVARVLMGRLSGRRRIVPPAQPRGAVPAPLQQHMRNQRTK
jgi:hypothetical protein